MPKSKNKAVAKAYAAKTAAKAKPGGGYKVQVGPTRPPYGSMLKAEGPKGKGRMK